MTGFRADATAVFVSGTGLSREAAFHAGARLHVRPAALQGSTCLCVAVTSDAAELAQVLDDARALQLPVWTVSAPEIARQERPRLVSVAGDALEFTFPSSVRRVDLSRVEVFVDLRWKASAETRVQVVLARESAPVIIDGRRLELGGPSRQGALLLLVTGLQRAIEATGPGRCQAVVLQPAAVGVPPDAPPELVAVALAEGRRRAGRT